MKKIILFVIIGFNLSLFVNAQLEISYSTGPNVNTCRGGVVATTVPNRELNSQELADIDYALFNQNGYYYYLGMQTSDIISSPTSYYNCHAYAWHLSEGNSNQVWINRGANDSNLSQYWAANIGCFIQVSASSAKKIYYYTGDHSAVKSPVAGKYESKWGAWYLFRHSPNQVPYSSPADRKYYAPFEVNAPNTIICDVNNLTFSTPDYVNCTYSWTYNTGSLNYVSGQGTNSFVVVPKNSRAGSAWVKLNLTIGPPINEIRSITKTFWVGPPNNSQISAMVMQGPPAGNQLCLNSYMTIAAGHSAVAAQGVNSYTWGFGNWDTPYFQEFSPAPGPSQARPEFYLPTGAPTPQILTISAENLCYPNTTPPFQKTFYAINCGFSLLFAPNPASDNTEVTLANTDETDNASYTVKVTNQYGQVLLVDEKSGKRFTLPTSTLKDGVYIIEVVKGNEVYRENLVVKH